mgnify:CR=1 FL=1
MLVIYHLSKSEEIEITFVNGDSKRISGNEIDEINSKKIFERKKNNVCVQKKRREEKDNLLPP